MAIEEEFSSEEMGKPLVMLVAIGALFRIASVHVPFWHPHPQVQVLQNWSGV